MNTVVIPLLTAAGMVVVLLQECVCVIRVTMETSASITAQVVGIAQLMLVNVTLVLLVHIAVPSALDMEIVPAPSVCVLRNGKEHFVKSLGVQMIAQGTEFVTALFVNVLVNQAGRVVIVVCMTVLESQVAMGEVNVQRLTDLLLVETARRDGWGQHAMIRVSMEHSPL